MCKSLVNFWCTTSVSLRARKRRKFAQGIVAFMVVWLKQSTPFVIQAIPQASQANAEVTFNGQWLVEKISDNIDSFIEIGLSLRGIVAGKHSAKSMRLQHWKIFNSELNCIKHPQNKSKTFYGTVYLMKNISNM